MFDKLIDILLSFWNQIVPFVIVNQTDKGIRLRLGKFKGVVAPGFHWKIPLIDELIVHTVLWTTISLTSQSLTSKDGKHVVIKGVIKYRIVDIQTFLLEVWDAIDAISDMTQGIIFDIVKDKSWEELQNIDLKPVITRKARLEAKRWGIEIETVTLSDLAKINSLRLLNDSGSIG
jgi:regulator of protease activity HflC (stomatin/prohibitin superfamily)